jgi:hypothetical protein
MLGDGMISDGEQVQWQCMIMWCRAFKVSSLQHSFFCYKKDRRRSICTSIFLKSKQQAQVVFLTKENA